MLLFPFLPSSQSQTRRRSSPAAGYILRRSPTLTPTTPSRNTTTSNSSSSPNHQQPRTTSSSQRAHSDTVFIFGSSSSAGKPCLVGLLFSLVFARCCPKSSCYHRASRSLVPPSRIHPQRYPTAIPLHVTPQSALRQANDIPVSLLFWFSLPVSQ